MITVSFGEKNGVVYAKFEAGGSFSPCYLKQGDNGKFEIITLSSQASLSIDFVKKQEISEEGVSINMVEFVNNQFQLQENDKSVSEETSDSSGSSPGSDNDSDKSSEELKKISHSHSTNTASVTLTPDLLTVENLKVIEEGGRKLKPQDQKGNLWAVQMLLVSVVLQRTAEYSVEELSIPTDIKLRKIKSNGNILFTIQNMKLISQDKKEFELKTEVRVEFHKENRNTLTLKNIKISGENTKLIENCLRGNDIDNDISSDNFVSVLVPVELLSNVNSTPDPKVSLETILDQISKLIKGSTNSTGIENMKIEFNNKQNENGSEKLINKLIDIVKERSGDGSFIQNCKQSFFRSHLIFDGRRKWVDSLYKALGSIHDINDEKQIKKLSDSLNIILGEKGTEEKTHEEANKNKFSEFNATKSISARFR